MKKNIEQLIKEALSALQAEGTLLEDFSSRVQVTSPKNHDHGDFSTNIALLIAGVLKKQPREMAQLLLDKIPSVDFVAKREIAGIGFINFSLTSMATHQVILDILQQKEKFGHSMIGHQQRVYLEFVSANPTGPLHVGHGRGAAFGACVANLLSAAGFKVHREYYVNDAGRQMQILALSVWLRYLELIGYTLSFPVNAYQGQYIIDIARSLHQEYPQEFMCEAAELAQQIPSPSQAEEDKESYIDHYIAAAQTLIGEDQFLIIQNTAVDDILTDIREDLEEFRVVYDRWFHESQLVAEGALNHVLEILHRARHTYESEGALWFRATEFGDEKDRVLIRENGKPTYFAMDTAYHLYKYETQSEQIIDIFGADHHGYVPRMKAFIAGLGKEVNRFKVLLVQFASLYRGKERISMSTREGSFVTLRELREEVGDDAARFFYIMRRPEQHLDFDLELAKSKSNENPVYYIQYAHARICSVFRQLQQKLSSSSLPDSWDEEEGKAHLSLLTTVCENEMINLISQYSTIVEDSALHFEPHNIAHYLQEVAGCFHRYYNSEQFLIENSSLRNARLCLIKAVQTVIKNALGLLGIQAPEEM